ncbi:hypothetical protein [Actinoplanes sp. NPDC026619]|uniref:hypothetical protein n=1 Tax=Actinoplanes sp. NPDC026619 TaxID=3155798 RepID=UPI0033F94781
MSAIELGDVTAGPAQAPEPPMYSRGLVRAVLALLTVLGLAATSASARPGPSRLLRPMWSIATTDLSQFSVTGDTVFVLNGGWDLTAYALADGRVRWSERLSERQTGATAEDLASLLLPSGYTQISREDAGGLAAFDSVTAATVALDPATGAERWRLPGGVGYRDAAVALLVEADPHGGRPKAFREVRIADGVVLWTRAADRPDFWIAGAGHLLTVGAQGRTEVVGLADGAGAVGRLPVRPGEPVAELDATALYLQSHDDGRLLVAAFDLATLRPRWTVDGGATAREAHLCGGVLCIGDGTATSGYDLATGLLRWRAAGWVSAATVTGGQLLAESTANAGHGLLDTGTGAFVADFGGGYPVWDTTAGTPAFLLRDTVDPPGRTAVFRLDSHSGDHRLRGSIDSLPGRTCVAVPDRLICHTTNGQLTVLAVA